MNLRDKINLYRRYPYWSAKRCIFVHVPKAAGTSINIALYGRPLGHYRASEIRQRFPILYKNSFVFSFVRNPWDRVLSAYRFAVRGRTQVMGVRNPSQYKIPEFETFERFLLEWLAPRDIVDLDYIFQSQHKFISGRDGESIVDFTGKIEEIDVQIKQVEDQLGFVLKIPHANRTRVDMDYAKAYRNHEMIDLVANVYRVDILAFDYDF